MTRYHSILFLLFNQVFVELERAILIILRHDGYTFC